MYRMCLKYQIRLVSFETEHADVHDCHIVHYFSQNLVFDSQNMNIFVM
jgi:hypothetical protein